MLEPRPVYQMTFPVGDCPVTVAVHSACEPAVTVRGAQTRVMFVGAAEASRGASRTIGVRTRTAARSKPATRTGGLMLLWRTPIASENSVFIYILDKKKMGLARRDPLV